MHCARIFALALVAATAFGQAGPEGSVQVVIQGIRNQAGRIGVAVYRDAAGFPDDSNQAFRVIELAPGQTTVTVDKLPAGQYAIAVRHDENGNGKLDKNAFGMPTEGWGVSNNIKPRMRAPRFDESRFSFDGGKRTVEIKVHY